MTAESVYTLRAQLAESEHARRVMQDRLRTVEDRAERAEKSARDAWAFARTVMQRPSY